MATVNFINRPKGQTRGGLFAVLSYTMKDEKTAFENRNLVSGVNCSPQSVYHEFINTKLLNGKCDGRMYYHFVQAFPKTEDISPQTAHEIALKLADFYKGYEILVCTHTDREHIHSHFVVNSVSLESGMKLHQSAHAIEEIRKVSDQLCMDYQLSICQPKEHRTKPMTAGEYYSAVRGNSWKMKLMNTIDECMQYAQSKDMFMELMESEGYKVKWTASRKNITYETPDGYKCRDNKLHEEKYQKEVMEHEFTIRRKIIFGQAPTAEQTESATTSTHREMQLDGGKCGHSVPQSEPWFGLDKGNARADTDLSRAESRNEIYDKQPTTQGRYGETLQETVGDGEDYCTGWEQERATLFATQAEITETSMDSGENYCGVDFADIGSDLLKLGKSLEQSYEPVSITPPPNHIDKKALKKLREKKIAAGHKEDDIGYNDFEMKMY